MDLTRTRKVAFALRRQIYTETFGGKARGKFLVSRESLKELLGVSRLSASDLDVLTTECLNIGLTVIDMDDSFAFAEKRFVKNWRKVPNNVVRKFVDMIDEELGVQEDFEEEPEEEEIDDGNDRQTNIRTPPRRIKRSV